MGATDHLSFTTLPNPATAAQTFTVVVAQHDAFENTQTGTDAAIAVSIHPGTGTGGAVLSGTLTQTSVSGVATFSDLSINLSNTGYELDAAISGGATGTSVPFNVDASTATPHHPRPRALGRECRRRSAPGGREGHGA